MRSRTQILQCKVLLKGIEFDFPLGKELKIDWKLPKSQFSIYSVIRKIKNRIENCPKPIFICLKLLKIENWIENRQKINFHFFEIIENWTKMKWTFSYTDAFWPTDLQSVHRKCHSIFILKLEWARTFLVISISIQNWKLKNDKNFSIFNFQFLLENWKLKIHFSFFNF